MTITLSDATWSALADEYGQALDGSHGVNSSLVGELNAEALAEYVRGQVLDTLPALSADSGLHWWRPVDDDTPYRDFAAMRAAWDRGRWLEVSDLWHDHPVFTREDNLRFRVWHDTAHLVEDLGFSDENEVELFVRQARGIGDRQVIDALFCESVYQLAYCRVNGGYPDRQVVRTPGPVARALLDGLGL
jgi:hypothetical protein